MTRPNILYIHSHDTGRYIQPYGYAVPTPNLQKLAEQGISWSDRKKFIFKWPISIIFIILGGWLMFAFLQLFILFNIEPAILWLDIFTATPEENALFVFLILLGLLLVVTGLWHLVLFFRERKNSAQ